MDHQIRLLLTLIGEYEFFHSVIDDKSKSANSPYLFPSLISQPETTAIRFEIESSKNAVILGYGYRRQLKGLVCFI